MDLQKEREFLNKVNEKMRQLELDKAKTEERKKLNDAAVKECENKMQELGCTPDTIQGIIDTKTAKAEEIKAKINAVLGGVENEL